MVAFTCQCYSIGSFKITVSMSVLVIVIRICYFFLVQSWKAVPFYEFVHFFQLIHFIGIELIVIVSYDSLYFCGVSYNFFFISNFSYLSSLLMSLRASLVAQMLKCLSAMQETWVRSLGREDFLEKEMATHSSTLAWKIPWIEEPVRLQPMGSQRVWHDWVTSLSLSINESG